MYDLIFTDKSFIIILEIYLTKPNKRSILDTIKHYEQYGFIGSFELKGE